MVVQSKGSFPDETIPNLLVLITVFPREISIGRSTQPHMLIDAGNCSIKVLNINLKYAHWSTLVPIESHTLQSQDHVLQEDKWFSEQLLTSFNVNFLMSITF